MGKYLDKQGVETLWNKTKALNAQKQDRTSDELTTEAKEIVPAINEAAASAKAAQERADVSAKTDGYYAEMRVGTADNLTARGDATTETFTRRTAGGDNAIEEGTATIKAVKGNSIVLNQSTGPDTPWYPVFGTMTKTGISISYTYGTVGIENFNQNRIAVNFFIRDAHKYLICFQLTTSKEGESFIACSSNAHTNQQTYTAKIGVNKIAVILTAIGTGKSDLRLGLPANDTINVGDIVSIEKIMSLDLTQMFGSGNEPATPEEFAARLGYASVSDIPYIPYNKGTIVDMTATGMRTAGTDDDGLAWTQERSWKPVIDKYFDGHLRSAGNVRDEIAANKAVKRIAAMDMGSRNWSSYTLQGVNIFFCHVPANFPINGNNIMQAEYSLISATSMMSSNDKSICNDSYIGSNYPLTIRDDSCATPADLIAKLKGKVLYYATTAPEEHDIDGQNLTIKVAPDGTEEIVAPEGDDVIASAPVVADMVYPIDSYKTIKDNKAHIGSVSSLATAAKSDLVAAINELTGRVAALETKATAETSTTEEEQ